MRHYVYTLALLLFTAGSISGMQPDSALFFKANVAFQKQDYQQAASLYSRVMQHKLPPVYRVKAGISLCKTGDYKQALQKLSKCNFFQKAEQTYWQARCYARQGNFDKAMDKIRAHGNSWLRFPENKLRMDSGFLKLSRTEAWRNFWDTSPYNENDALYEDALTQFRDEHYEYALELLDKVLARTEDLRAYRLRAKVLAVTGSYKAAVNDLNKLVDYFPTHPALLKRKARILLQAGKQRRALQAINQALKHDPYAPDFYKMRGKILASKGKDIAGKKDFKKYLAYKKGDASAYYQLGRIMYNQEQYLEALKKFNQCLKLGKDNPAFLKARGKTYLKTKTYKRAEADFSMALDLQPTGELYYLRGNARFYSGDIRGACSDWERALVKGYNDAIINKERLCK